VSDLDIARLQFATTTAIHFLFVLLTLGLVTLLVILQTTWLITKNPKYGDWIIRTRVPLFLLLVAMPIPFFAAVMGWLFREGGRQPWAAYGLLSVRDAMTPGTSPLAGFIVFTAVLAGLAVTDWFLIARAANRGPVAPREDALTPLA
jgi:cytochrome d ubiquinol oxidase subunit I